MTCQAMELCFCALLLIVELQCKDQLPEGKYWNLDAASIAKFSNVPTTNVVCERDFAILDFLVRRKPDARILSMKTMIMWSNNKTSQWLDTLDSQTKARFMEQARAHGPKILCHYQETMKTSRKSDGSYYRKKKKKKATRKGCQRSEASCNLCRAYKQNCNTRWCFDHNTNNPIKICGASWGGSDKEIKWALYTQLTLEDSQVKGI